MTLARFSVLIPSMPFERVLHECIGLFSQLVYLQQRLVGGAVIALRHGIGWIA